MRSFYLIYFIITRALGLLGGFQLFVTLNFELIFNKCFQIDDVYDVLFCWKIANCF